MVCGFLASATTPWDFGFGPESVSSSKMEEEARSPRTRVGPFGFAVTFSRSTAGFPFGAASLTSLTSLRFGRSQSKRVRVWVVGRMVVAEVVASQIMLVQPHLLPIRRAYSADDDRHQYRFTYP